jgi:HAD superfamily hydrolase (TIGR01509 family)
MLHVKHRPPDLLVLDLDGVLIDSEAVSAAVLIETAAEAGVAIDAAYVAERCLGRSFPTVARALAETFDVALPPDFEARYRARLLGRFETELRPMPGVEDVLGRLAVPACIATSSSPQRAARSLAIAGLDRWGLRVFTASEVARGKPAPDLFLHAAGAMGAAPARCLVVEDSLPGLEAAQAAGMASVRFVGGSHLAAAFDSGAVPRALRSWAEVVEACPALVRPQESA